MSGLRAVSVVLLLAVAAGTAGCLSKKPPVKQRYVLPVERTGASAHGELGVLRVGRIRVSPLFERKGFVYRTGEEQYEDDFYNEFFAPPGTVLQKAVLTWMAASPLFSAVLDPSNRARADWLIEGRADGLYGDLRDPETPLGVVEIEFTVTDMRSTRREVAFQKKYRSDARASEATAEAIAGAWRRAVTEVLAELEADLEAALGRAPARATMPPG